MIIYIMSAADNGGIYQCNFQSRKLSIDRFYQIGSVMHACFDHDNLYVLLKSASQESSVCFAKRNADGELGRFSKPVSVMGTEGCYIDCLNGRYFTANYSSGNIYRSGNITVQHNGSGFDKIRQEASHPHQAIITPDKKYVAVCDLGLDAIYTYDFELQCKYICNVHQGSGIRHLEFARDGKTAYSTNELNGTVSTFNYNDGKFDFVNSIDILPDVQNNKKIYPSALHISDDSNYLFALSRVNDYISAYDISNRAEPDFICSQKIDGSFPRDFCIIDNYVIICNEKSDNICVYTFDKSGFKYISGCEIPVPMAAVRYIEN